jgi:hypothetical protein
VKVKGGWHIGLTLPLPYNTYWAWGMGHGDFGFWILDFGLLGIGKKVLSSPLHFFTPSPLHSPTPPRGDRESSCLSNNLQYISKKCYLKFNICCMIIPVTKWSNFHEN